LWGVWGVDLGFWVQPGGGLVDGSGEGWIGAVFEVPALHEGVVHALFFLGDGDLGDWRYGAVVGVVNGLFDRFDGWIFGFGKI